MSIKKIFFSGEVKDSKFSLFCCYFTRELTHPPTYPPIPPPFPTHPPTQPMQRAHPSLRPLKSAGHNTQFADHRAAGRLSAPPGETLPLFTSSTHRAFQRERARARAPEGTAERVGA
jgi:hypothetical protein